MMKGKSCALAAALLLGGCAAQRTANDVASASASILNDYRRELSAFADRQTSLNRDNQRQIGDIRALSSERDARINERILALKLAGDKTALEMFDHLSKPTGSTIMDSSAALNSLKPVPAATKVEVDTATAAALVKQLKVLQETKPLISRIFGLVEYRQALAETYRKSLEQAEGGAKQAEAGAERATGALMKSSADGKAKP
jgi:hypothetical protein